jgi:hypothetical protein
VLLIKALGGGFDAATLNNLNLTARNQPTAATSTSGR